VQNELGVAKAFYFCFFGAFGSLFPLMAVFFKVKTMSLLILNKELFVLRV
jgi:hypothetical protein